MYRQRVGAASLHVQSDRGGGDRRGHFRHHSDLAAFASSRGVKTESGGKEGTSEMNLKQRFEKLNDNIRLDEAVRQKRSGGAQPPRRPAGRASWRRQEEPGCRAASPATTMLGPQTPGHRQSRRVRRQVGGLTLQGPGGPQKAISLVHDALAPHLPGARFEVKEARPRHHPPR